MPDVLRLTDQWQADGAHAGFALTRMGTGPLDTGLSLQAQGVRSGDLLYLRSITEMLPPAVYDDVAEVIANAVSEDGRQWGAAAMRGFGLGAASLLLVLGAVVLWFAGRTPLGQVDPHGVPAIIAAVLAVLLLTIGAVRSRVYQDHVSGAVIGGSSTLYAFVAGAGILPVDDGSGVGREHFLVGCGAAMVLAIVGAVLQEAHDEAFVAVAVSAGVGLVAGVVLLVSGVTAVDGAAVTGTVGLAALGFLPGLVLRFTRFPMPVFTDGAPRLSEDGQSTLPEGDDTPIDVEYVRGQATRGAEVLAGLVAACGIVVTCSSVVLSFGLASNHGGVWAWILSLILGIGSLTRARLFRRTSQVLPLVTAGAVSLTFLALGVSLHVSQISRESWLLVAVLVCALLALLVGLRLPGRSLSPGWGRFVDVTESLMLAALLPIAIEVLRLYTTMKSLV
jgi:type VII secretion integral membrane protein EccD